MSQCQSMASLFQAFRMWGQRKRCVSRKIGETSRHTPLLSKSLEQDSPCQSRLLPTLNQNLSDLLPGLVSLGFWLLHEDE